MKIADVQENEHLFQCDQCGEQVSVKITERYRDAGFTETKLARGKLMALHGWWCPLLWEERGHELCKHCAEKEKVAKKAGNYKLFEDILQNYTKYAKRIKQTKQRIEELKKTQEDLWNSFSRATKTLLDTIDSQLQL